MFHSLKDFSSPDVDPVTRLDAIYQLADYCIDLLQQNQEHHGEVRSKQHARKCLLTPIFMSQIFSRQALELFSTFLVEHTELFWSLFTVDLDAALDVQPLDSWDSFNLFQLLNDFFHKEGWYSHQWTHTHPHSQPCSSRHQFPHQAWLVRWIFTANR